MTGRRLSELRYKGYISNEEYEEIKKALQEPKTDSDCISRQAVLDKKELVELEDGQSFYCISPEDVETLQPVNPQEPKTIPIPKNATNGDMIKFVFPKARVRNLYIVNDNEVYDVFIDNTKDCTIEMRVMKNWWNAPYKERRERNV